MFASLTPKYGLTNIFTISDLSATAFYGSIDVIDFVSKNFNFRHFLRPLQDHDRVKVHKSWLQIM